MNEAELKYVCEKMGIDDELSVLISDGDALGVLKAISESYQLVDIRYGELEGDYPVECPDCGCVL